MDVRFIEEISKYSPNIVFVTDSKLTLPESAKEIEEIANISVQNIIKAQDYKGKYGEVLAIPTGTEKIKNVLVVSAGDIEKLSSPCALKLGGKICATLQCKKATEVKLYFADIFDSEAQKKSIVFDVMLGSLIRSYRFDKYLSKKKDKINLIEVIFENPNRANLEFEMSKAVFEGTNLARDLISEPPNVLNPSSFAKICSDLKHLKVDVEILEEDKMAELGMNALLGVAQGSVNKPRLVVMRWNGGKKGDAPIAFVGKGVTFDTGGLSLKPAGAMVGMKHDMAGAAVVAGLIKTLALRKAPVNVVGVTGMVENMPDGNAQRPEDVVKSMSGQTIEILNTDAEGRLVLADALWYTQDAFKPKFMIDLATLTGAIVVSLGDKYAGIFSNNDKISQEIYDAGIATGEKVWRLPLGEEYDKMIDSKVADMQNIGNDKSGAGSITAAQFLQRFVNNVPWLHIDIAGVTTTRKNSDLYEEGYTAFGVMLLNKFLKDNYEK